MTQEQFEMLEQSMLNVHNETVVACANLINTMKNLNNKELSQKILETFLFKDLNELRQYHSANIISIENRETQA